MKLRHALVLSLLVSPLTFGAFAADVTGVWNGQLTDREGGLHDISFDFKAVGAKLTGTVIVIPETPH